MRQRRRRETTATVLEQRIPLSFKQTLAPSFPPLPSCSTPSTSSGSKPDTSQQASNDNDDPHLQACMQNLIASYLNYRGYSETARSFRKQREAERHLWRDVVSELAASYAATVAAASASDGPTNGVSGSSTPAKKKGKRKSEGGSKKLLKSALRTTLAGSEQASEVPMDTEDSQTRIEPVMDDDDEMQSTSELDKSTSRATPTGVRDDLMTTDVKKSSTGMDDLEADEAELEDTLHRQNVCSALRRGDVDLAMREIEDHYPGVILPSARDSLRAMLNGKHDSNNDEACKLRRTELLFKLRCRKFVELVLASSAIDGTKEDDADMEAEFEEDEDEQIASQLISSNGSSPQVVTAENHALSSNKGKGKAAGSSEAGNSTPQVSFDQVLSYGSQLNSLYPANDPNTPPHVLSQLKLLFSLVAYANPADLSSHGNKAIYELTRQDERDRLAEEVNKAMLESKGQPGIPHLELIYKQAHTVRNVLGDVFGDGRAALLGDVVDT